MVSNSFLKEMRVPKRFYNSFRIYKFVLDLYPYFTFHLVYFYIKMSNESEC